MEICPHLEKCIYYREKLSINTAIGEMFKQHYCADNWRDCARVMICDAVGIDKVPKNMHPTMTDWARTLIESEEKIRNCIISAELLMFKENSKLKGINGIQSLEPPY